MSLRVEDILFSPGPDESPESHAERVRQLTTIIERVLDNSSGHELVNMLLEARNPVLSRFEPGGDALGAAFRDGQADVIGFLLIHGTSLGIANSKTTIP